MNLSLQNSCWIVWTSFQSRPDTWN